MGGMLACCKVGKWLTHRSLQQIFLQHRLRRTRWRCESGPTRRRVDDIAENALRNCGDSERRKTFYSDVSVEEFLFSRLMWFRVHLTSPPMAACEVNLAVGVCT